MTVKPSVSADAPSAAELPIQQKAIAMKNHTEPSASSSAGFDITSPLINASKQLFYFLRELHQLGISTKPPSNESFRRYTQLWLPFVYKHNKNNTAELIPPPDIAWLWHCHRLAPYRYLSYIRKRFGDDNAYLEQNPPFVFTDGGFCPETKETRKLFKHDYPNEFFFLTEDSSNVKMDTTLDGFDVIQSCTRQSTFLWQVSSPEIRESDFLRQGVENYEKFVKLMARPDKPQYIIPTYQIDLMWHTHILHSIRKYHEYNMRLNNKILDHDDSLNDRSVGSTLNTNFDATRKLWKEVYNEEYEVSGGMYRGEPPAEYYGSDWQPPATVQEPIEEWMSIDHPLAFKPAKPKSTSSTNNNPHISGYVFGKGGKSFGDPSMRRNDVQYVLNQCLNLYIVNGFGYYNLKTREAYDVLVKRLQTSLDKFWLFMLFPPLWLCIPCLLAERKRVKCVLQIAKKRKDADGPSADLNLPPELKREIVSRDRIVSGTAGSCGGEWECYSGAAGCGAVGAAGCGGGTFI